MRSGQNGILLRWPESHQSWCKEWRCLLYWDSNDTRFQASKTSRRVYQCHVHSRKRCHRIRRLCCRTVFRCRWARPTVPCQGLYPSYWERNSTTLRRKRNYIVPQNGWPRRQGSKSVYRKDISHRHKIWCNTGLSRCRCKEPSQINGTSSSRWIWHRGFQEDDSYLLSIGRRPLPECRQDDNEVCRRASPRTFQSRWDKGWTERRKD